MAMIEVIYRVYEVTNSSSNTSESESESESEIISQDVLICEDRNKFKEIIKGMYGEEVKFANSKKYKFGQIFCIIISENCYNTSSYISLMEFECAECGVKTKSIERCIIKYKEYEIKKYFSKADDIERLMSYKFCCNKCAERFFEKEKKQLAQSMDINSNEWISKESFSTSQNSCYYGYIYKISKKSTNEFYVGQTTYVPIFRWDSI